MEAESPLTTGIDSRWNRNDFAIFSLEEAMSLSPNSFRKRLASEPHGPSVPAPAGTK